MHSRTDDITSLLVKIPLFFPMSVTALSKERSDPSLKLTACELLSTYIHNHNEVVWWSIRG